MTEIEPKPKKITVDIGGGVGDYMRSPVRPEDFITFSEAVKKKQEIESNEYWMTRALRMAKMAEQYPEEEFVIVDPNALSRAEIEVTRKFKNLRFVHLSSDTSESLPFRAESIDTIEMNFLFTPLTGVQHFAAVKSGSGDTWWRTRFTDPKEYPLYTHTLKDAARALKKGGTLIITEKNQRMGRILSTLSASPESRPGTTPSAYLLSMGLAIESVGPLENTERSLYARAAVNQSVYSQTAGRSQDAEDAAPMILVLKKVI